MSEIIPFYGVDRPDLFEIERRCMDRDRKLISYLDDRLPVGTVLDIGAGNGFTANKLSSAGRQVLACEPSPGMIDRCVLVLWIRGSAQHLPLPKASIESAYATWAFFFSGREETDAGLDELYRVVRPGGSIAIADNAGGCAFCGLFDRDISSDADWWGERGFSCDIVKSAYRFDNLDEAERLFDLYWAYNGKPQGAELSLEIGHDIAVYQKVMG